MNTTTPPGFRLRNRCFRSRIFHCIYVVGLWILFAPILSGQGFIEPAVVLYGKVLNVDEGASFQLFDGELTITFVNESDPENAVVMSAFLGPTGITEEFSYALDIPQKYLPADEELDSTLSVNSAMTVYRLESMTIDGADAVPLNGDTSSIETSFASRAAEIRLDLRVTLPQSDMDGDDMPDWWEELHGLNPQFAADRDRDPDSDTLSNYEEFLLGTDPNVSNVEPSLLAASISVTERGWAGVLFKVVDSDTGPESVLIELAELSTGFVLENDGAPMNPGDDFSVQQMREGRIVLNHLDVSAGDGVLKVKFASSDEVIPIAITVDRPSREDGSDALLWLDGLTVAGTENSPVLTWADRSGNDHDAMQVNSTQAPVLSSGNGIDFSDSEAHLRLAEGAFPGNAHTAFTVYQSPGVADAQTIFSSNKVRLTIQPGDGPVSYPNAESYEWNQFEISGTQDATGSVNLSVTVADGNDGRSWLNGIHNGLAEANPRNTPAVVPTLGAQYRAGAAPGGQQNGAPPGASPLTQPFHGTIHEILLYPAVLSRARVVAIGNYLRAKWQGAVVWSFQSETSPVTLSTGDANSVIQGGWGSDMLAGGGGNDILSGGWGDDTLDGGLGLDVFVYSSLDRGHDRILQFDEGDDILDLSFFFTKVSTRVDNHIQFATDGVDTVITIDIGGDGGASDLAITLVDLPRTNIDRNRWIGEGVLLTGALRLDQTVAVTATGPELAPSTPVDFSITRSGITGHRLTVPLAVSGDAVRGFEYTLSNVGGTDTRPTITFKAGEREKRIGIQPHPENLTVASKIVRLEVLANRPYMVDRQAMSAGVILRGRPTELSVAASTPTADEATGDFGRFTISRTRSSASDLAVAFRLGGTATNGVDYQFVESVVVIPAGQTAVDVDIVPINDGSGEGDETVSILLLVEPGPGPRLGEHPSAAVTIKDAPPVVSIEALEPTASTPDITPGFFLVSRNGAFAKNLLVRLQIDGTAVNGLDYEHVQSFVNIEPNASSAIIRILPRLNVIESGRTVELTIAADSSYTIGASNQATVTIVRNKFTPGVAVNAVLNVIQGQTATINSNVLRATDVDDEDATLVFTILSLPQSGVLTNDSVALKAGNIFTQDDIDANRISYTHDSSNILLDNFTFTVADDDGQTTAVTRFDISVTDDQPPIASVRWMSPTRLDVAFTETVTGAANISNYAFDPALTVFSITVSGPPGLDTRYTLVTSTQQQDQLYTATLSNIVDLAGNPVANNPQFQSGAFFSIDVDGGARSLVFGQSSEATNNFDADFDEAASERMSANLPDVFLLNRDSADLENRRLLTDIRPLSVAEPTRWRLVVDMSGNDGVCVLNWQLPDESVGRESANGRYLFLQRLDGEQPVGASIDMNADWTLTVFEDGVYEIAFGVQQSSALLLSAGWSLVGVPVMNTRIADDVLAGTGAGPIYFWKAGDYDAVPPGAALNPERAYWLHATTVATRPVVSGILADGVTELVPGWNLISPVADVPIPDSPLISTVWGWNGATQSFAQPSAGELVSGAGYWIYLAGSEKHRIQTGL